jgi:hypothetical protein
VKRNVACEASAVARWNSIATEDERLRAHLFGANRTSFPRKFRDDLADIRCNACFYCGDRLAARREVDHFLAWSRWPNDAVENLVLADRCNNAESDHLAAVGHLGFWKDRRDRHGDDLAQLGADARWISDPQRTNGLTTSTYAHVAAGTPLWVHGSRFDLATGPIHIDTVG